MKLTLPALPIELTEAGWKNQSALFRSDVNLDKPLRFFAAAYLAVQRDLPDDKFPTAYKALLAAQTALHKASGALLAYAAKLPGVQKTTLDQIRKVQNSAAKILAVIDGAHQRAEDACKAKKTSGRGEVRIQLQQGSNHLWNSENKGIISAKNAIDKLNQLYRDKKKLINDPAWEKGLVAAIHKLTGLIKNAQSKGGMKPDGSGNKLRAEFDCARKTYRVDIELHGDEDLDFFA